MERITIFEQPMRRDMLVRTFCALAIISIIIIISLIIDNEFLLMLGCVLATILVVKLVTDAIIDNERRERRRYRRIVAAIANKYTSLYSVNLVTDEYTRYRHDGSHGNALISEHGEGFFGAGREESISHVYPADRKLFAEAYTKENVLDALDKRGVFILTYRVKDKNDDNKPTYLGMRISRIEDEEDYVVVGISNMDAAMKRREELERIQADQAAYERISALSDNYLVVYSIDAKTFNYHAYSNMDEFRRLSLKVEGEDFIEEARKRCVEVVYPEDLGMVLSLGTKENILHDIEAHGVFVINYRMMIDGVPTYVSLRIAEVEEEDGTRLIAGMSNIDAQARREREYYLAQQRASKDALTGVKNKLAYQNAERELDDLLEHGLRTEYAIVMCDLNNLKTTNDEQGHLAGDELILQASKMICNVFKHSPVFRIGGDEFAIILQGHDYEHRDELLQELQQQSKQNAQEEKATLAWGIATFESNEKVADVFARADAAMYENKRASKQQA